MSKTNPIDPNVPAGSESPKLGDNRIRELAAAVAEILNVDHYIGTNGGSGVGYNEDAAGEHKKVTLRTGSAPTSSANKIFIYAKDVDGKAEAHLKDEDGNVIQLTTAGKIKKSYFEDSSFVPTGAFMPFGGSVAPAGFLLCDGSAVSRTTYAALFAVMGTNYGVGDSSTTFNVPDMMGRVPVGLDAANANLEAADALGETGGEENHTLSIAETPAHYHTMVAQRGSTGDNPGLDRYCSSIAINSYGASYTGYTGGGGSHNNLQPYNTCNYIVKT